MHDAKKDSAGHIAGEAADDASLELEFEGVAEALVHEGNALIVGREVGALTEVSEDFDV